MLDLTTYEAAADTPEVAALKEKVRTVAKKYATRHSWCDVVNRALREMGVDDKPVSVPVTATLNNGLTFTVKVPLADLLNKNDERQRTKVSSLIGTVAMIGNNGAKGTLLVAPEDISDLTNPPAPAPAAAPDGTMEGQVGLWLYTSDRGSVLHYYPTAVMTRGVISRGDHSSWSTRFTAQCGVEQYTPPVTDSPAGGGGHCTRCQRRVDNQ